MLLLDPLTRRLRPASEDVVDHRGSTEHELFLEQVETQSEPHVDLQDVRRDLARARSDAAASARAAGARLAAVPLPVLPDHDGQVTPKERYRLMLAEFAEIGRDAIACGTHVHVEISDDDEGVAVIDRLRAWLPLVLALSANSPYFRGTDTGHASWRAQVWDTWPSAGPIEPFGGAFEYRAAVADLVASGAAIDEAMVYFDARLARSYPTVEIRVADVCTDLDDTLVVAAIVRGLVETQSAMWRRLTPVPRWRVDLLRAARWQARRNGLDGQLIDPTTGKLVTAARALATLMQSIEPALRDAGDFDLVREGVERLLRDGTGAARQRAVAGSQLDLVAVVDDVIARTAH